MRIRILILGFKGLISFSWQNFSDLLNSEHNFDGLNRPIPIQRSQHVRRRIQQLIIHVSGRGTSGAVTIAAWLTPSPLPPPQKTILPKFNEKGFSSTFKRILFTFLTEYCLCKQHPKIASFHILSAMLLQSGIACQPFKESLFKSLAVNCSIILKGSIYLVC